MLRIFSPDGADDLSRRRHTVRQSARNRARARSQIRRQAAGGECVAAEPVLRRQTLLDIRPQSAHRINTPVRSAGSVPAAESRPAKAQDTSPTVGPLAVDPRILAISAKVAAGSTALVVPEWERGIYAALPLRAWYEADIYGPGMERRFEIEAGRNESGTAEKDYSALSVWERFTRPADWSGDWPGISISAITTDYLRQWQQAALAGGLSTGYLSGLTNHLNWMLHTAVNRCVLAKSPKKPTLKQREDLTVIFEIGGDILGTLDAIHGQLAGNAELQAAFVLSVSVGLRPSDLFALTWRNLETIQGVPAIVTTPQKTRRYGKSLRIPLAECVNGRLKALRASRPADTDNSLIFPSLTSDETTQPEKSRAARRRTAAMRAAAELAGFRFPKSPAKPWQIARATCNERLERHRPGVGEYVLGHSAAGINKKHYRQRWSEAVDAINTLPQPASFLVSPVSSERM